MTITVGTALPDATLLQMGAKGAEGVSMAARLKGRKVVIFGLRAGGGRRGTLES